MPDYPRVCHFLEGGLARCCASCLRMWILFARVSMLSVGIYDLCACVHGLRAYIHMIYVRVFGEGDRGHARHWG